MGDLDNPEEGTLRDMLSDIWANEEYAAQLAPQNLFNPDDLSDPLKKDYWDTSLEGIEKGTPDILKRKHSANDVKSSRIDEAVEHVVEVTWVAQRIKDSKLVSALSEYIDSVVDYTATNIFGDSPRGIERVLRIMKKYLRGSIHVLNQ